MSVTFSTSLRPEGTKTSATGPRIMKDLWAKIARYPVRRAAVAHLREFDNDALRDIGLARSEIEAAVYGRMTGPNRART